MADGEGHVRLEVFHHILSLSSIADALRLTPRKRHRLHIVSSLSLGVLHERTPGKDCDDNILRHIVRSVLIRIPRNLSMIQTGESCVRVGRVLQFHVCVLPCGKFVNVRLADKRLATIETNVEVGSVLIARVADIGKHRNVVAYANLVNHGAYVAHRKIKGQRVVHVYLVYIKRHDGRKVFGIATNTCEDELHVFVRTKVRKAVAIFQPAAVVVFTVEIVGQNVVELMALAVRSAQSHTQMMDGTLHVPYIERETRIMRVLQRYLRSDKVRAGACGNRREGYEAVVKIGSIGVCAVLHDVPFCERTHRAVPRTTLHAALCERFGIRHSVRLAHENGVRGCGDALALLRARRDDIPCQSLLVALHCHLLRERRFADRGALKRAAIHIGDVILQRSLVYQASVLTL